MQFVSVCGDAGPGTLRDAVGAAAEGETIDMTQLACSPISLTTGAIPVKQNSLTIAGPGALLVTGKDSPTPDRIFNHTGTGTLQLYSFSIAYGALSNASGDALGGCIYSSGSVATEFVSVTDCSASSTTFFGNARGGGIFTRGDLTLKYGSLSNNTATSGGGGIAYGGGAEAYGTLFANLATISGNYAHSATDRLLGGGLRAHGDVDIVGSTISGNRSSKAVGGILSSHETPASATLRIVNSTISGNSAAGAVGGVYTDSATTQIYSTTIAFNTAAGETIGSLHEAPGLAVVAIFSDIAFKLESVLLANNTYGSAPATEDDLSESVANNRTITLTAANDLVRVSSVSLPSGTLVAACPLLGPLRDNGGPTWTHALLSTSPAIDAGNDDAINPMTKAPYVFDQRGSGFSRVSGTSADIGAYEVQADQLPGCSTIDRVVHNNNDSGVGSLRDVIASVCGGRR